MKSDKIYLALFFIIIFTSLSWIVSCTHKVDISGFTEVCFTRDVLPIFQNNCAISHCHEGGRELSFSDYAGISRNVVAGDPNGSRLYKVITETWGFNRMPPKQPLSKANRTTIMLWILQGATNATCTVPSDTTGTGTGTGTGDAGVKRACFTRDILPVLVSRCGIASCHDAITHKSGYNFTSFSGVMATVTAGSPSGSRLYRTITNTSGEDKMPPSSKSQLTAAEIDSIGKWIGYGALNETCTVPCDTVNTVTFAGQIWPMVQSTCMGCHSGSSPSGGISLNSYANVASIASAGTLVNAINGAGVAKMPPSGALTTCQKREIAIWVNNGYLNN